MLLHAESGRWLPVTVSSKCPTKETVECILDAFSRPLHYPFPFTFSRRGKFRTEPAITFDSFDARPLRRILINFRRSKKRTSGENLRRLLRTGIFKARNHDGNKRSVPNGSNTIEKVCARAYVSLHPLL